MIESKWGGGEIWRTCPDRPFVPPSFLYNGYGVCFPEVKLQWSCTTTPHPPLWAFMACSSVNFAHTLRCKLFFFTNMYPPLTYISVKYKMDPFIEFCRHESSKINHLTPNDLHRGRTAPLTSKRCILYIHSTNIGTEYFKHGINSPFFFSLQNAVCFIIITYLVPVFTFYIQGVLKF